MQATHKLTIGHDTFLVTLGMPEHPILVDGRATGLQFADARCSVERAMRLLVERIDPQADWDEDVAYEPVDDAAEVV